MAFENTGSGFTNLQKVVEANQNNKLGSTIQSGITGAANKTTGDINNSFQQFQGDVNNQNLDTSQNRQTIQNTLGKITGPNQGNSPITFDTSGGLDTPSSTPLSPSGGGDTNQANNTPSTSTNPSTSTPWTPGVSAGDQSAFAQFRGGAYNGPQDLTNYNFGNIQSEAQDTQQLGQDVNNGGGRQALLQRFAGGNNYNQGEQNLDQILLGQTGAQNLQASRQATQGLTNQANQANLNAQSVAQQQAAKNKAFADYTQQQIGNTLNPITGSVNDQLTAEQNAQTAQNNNYQSIYNLLSSNPANGSTYTAPSTTPAGTTTNTSISPGATTPAAASTDPKVIESNRASLANQALQQMSQQGLVNGTDLKSWQDEINNVQQYNVSHPDAPIDYMQALQQATGNNAATNLNQAGATNEQQAAQINALNQLSGKTPTYSDLTQVGNYGAGSLGFNQQQALASINNQLPQATQNQDSSGTASWNAPQLGQGYINAANDLSQSNLGGAAENWITAPIQDITNFTGGGGGGGGKIICNELHRQGYLSDEIIKLDEAYGFQFRRYNFDAYRGYLILARPVVNLMRKNKYITKLVSIVAIPWARYMANAMDSSYAPSSLGSFINKIGITILPLVYKVKKYNELNGRAYKQT